MHCSANVGPRGDCAIFFGLSGTILENVAMDAGTRRLDLDDATLTENTRAAYPISHIPNAGGSEPEATFSTCFGAPFMALHPSVYTAPAAPAGRAHRRARGPLLAHQHGLERRAFRRGRAPGYPSHPGHGARGPGRRPGRGAHAPRPGLRRGGVPQECPGVPASVLNPRSTWKDKEAHDRAARDLGARFRADLTQYEEHVAEEVRQAGPAAD